MRDDWTRLALALFAAGTVEAAAVTMTDPVNGMKIRLTGERMDPLDDVRPRAAPATKGGRIPELHSLGDYWFTCPPWRGVPWVMLTETICASPLVRDPLGVASTYDRPRLWTSCDCTETRTGDPHAPPRPEPDRPRNGAGPEPGRVPLPATLGLLLAAMVMMWRMR